VHRSKRIYTLGIASDKPTLSVPICGSNPIVLPQFVQRTILKVLLFWRTS
jgi:hypothetical protein